MVRIRDDLVYQCRYGGTYINRNKWRFRGREVQICEVVYDYSKRKYVFRTNYPYESWSEECFQKQEELPDVELTVEEWMMIL